MAATLAEPKPIVIFATAFDAFALDAFSLDATDYLLKPITRARLSGALARVRNRLTARSADDRELQAAARAQSRLMSPVLPSISGFDCAAVTLPARTVSGDFFLARALGGDRFCVALGDVAGKGISAGLVASSLQARLETRADAGSTPATVISDVNRALCATTDTSRFATLIYAEIDAKARTADIVNAGHLPAITVAEHVHQMWASTGPALGILPDASFDQLPLTLSAGTTLILFSDGVSEAIDDAGEELGAARVAIEAATHRHLSADGLCHHILEVVRHHRAGAPPADDTTVMVIRAHSDR